MSDLTQFSTRDFREALSAFPTGVTVVTTQGNTHPYGMTANAFSSVSLDPPLVLICVVDETEGASSIQQNGAFAVNVLAVEQEPLARYFASRDRPREGAMFDRVSHTRSGAGSPVLDGIAAHFDCTLDSAFKAGDHVVFIGKVVGVHVDRTVQPLVFHHAAYKKVERR